MLEFEYLINVLNRVEKELDKQTEERIIKLEGAKELISILKSEADADKAEANPFSTVHLINTHTEHIIGKPSERPDEVNRLAMELYQSTLARRGVLVGKISIHSHVEELADGYCSVVFNVFSDNDSDV